MAMDGLATPLGMKPRVLRKGKFLSGRLLAIAVIAVGGIIIASMLISNRSNKSGEPMASAIIERKSAGVSTLPAQRADIKPPETNTGDAQLPSRSAAMEIENNSGVKVVRQNGGAAPGSSIIRIHEPSSAIALAPAPDPRVSERSPHGILPRAGENGINPRSLYARPFTPSGNPVVAVVLTGVGINARGTADAIARLPGTVTLAFAPYGRDLEAQVLRARRDGHEVMLQVPMEPFDFPDNDPGPHTIRAGSSPQENIERLNWLMSRFQGYVGIMNFMGGKLMATNTAYKPVLEEINKRGLLYLDDGSVRKTLSTDIAGAIRLPIVKADRIAENAAGAPGLRTLLAETEAVAKKSGRAVIVVPALPANIEILAGWEAELSQRGLTLAPLSGISGAKLP